MLRVAALIRQCPAPAVVLCRHGGARLRPESSTPGHLPGTRLRGKLDVADDEAARPNRRGFLPGRSRTATAARRPAAPRFVTRLRRVSRSDPLRLKGRSARNAYERCGGVGTRRAVARRHHATAPRRGAPPEFAEQADDEDLHSSTGDPDLVRSGRFEASPRFASRSACLPAYTPPDAPDASRRGRDHAGVARGRPRTATRTEPAVGKLRTAYVQSRESPVPRPSGTDGPLRSDFYSATLSLLVRNALTPNSQHAAF